MKRNGLLGMLGFVGAMAVVGVGYTSRADANTTTTRVKVITTAIAPTNPNIPNSPYLFIFL